MATLELAMEIAARARARQLDKAGAPYILHPLRVMLALKREPEQIAGVLHDVIEDGGIILEQLRAAGFGLEIVCTLDALTRRPDEPYGHYVTRAARDPLARPVKLMELEDNMMLSRIPHPSATNFERLRKYERAVKLINATALA